MLQTALTVQETVANSPKDVVVSKGPVTSIVEKQAGHGPDAQPVFRSESGGTLMTLPGGVLLSLDPGWSEADVERFFADNGIAADRAAGIGFLPNGFLIETEPGFPSLDLANELAEQPGVVMSSPNWQREIEPR